MDSFFILQKQLSVRRSGSSASSPEDSQVITRNPSGVHGRVHKNLVFNTLQSCCDTWRTESRPTLTFKQLCHWDENNLWHNASQSRTQTPSAFNMHYIFTLWVGGGGSESTSVGPLSFPERSHVPIAGTNFFHQPFIYICTTSLFAEGILYQRFLRRASTSLTTRAKEGREEGCPKERGHTLVQTFWSSLKKNVNWKI